MADQVLTNKQQMFVAEYQVDFNATQAAIRAGYSSKTANRIGPELLKKPYIAKIIAAKKQELLNGLPDDVFSIPVRIEPISLIGALIGTGRLAQKDAKNKKAVTLAVERLIADWAEEQSTLEQFESLVEQWGWPTEI